MNNNNNNMIGWLFRGIQEYIALDANHIPVFDSCNIVNISGNIFKAIQYYIIISVRLSYIEKKWILRMLMKHLDMFVKLLHLLSTESVECYYVNVSIHDFMVILEHNMHNEKALYFLVNNHKRGFLYIYQF